MMTISVFAAAKHLGKQTGWSIWNLDMQKILYIAHRYHLFKYDEPLVDGLFEAWNYGPVHPELYHYAKAFGANPVKNIFRSYKDLENEKNRNRGS